MSRYRIHHSAGMEGDNEILAYLLNVIDIGHCDFRVTFSPRKNSNKKFHGFLLIGVIWSRVIHILEK